MLTKKVLSIISRVASVAVLAMCSLSAQAVDPPAAGWLAIKQVNLISYYNPATSGSDSLSLSGYLAPGPDLSDPLAPYCDNYIGIDIGLYHNWYYAPAAYFGQLLPISQSPPPGRTKCRLYGSSSSPGVQDLVFEVVQLGSVKYVYMTLLINGKGFDWYPDVDYLLPGIPPRGSIYYFWMSLWIDGGWLPYQNIWTWSPLKVCDANERKVKLCMTYAY